MHQPPARHTRTVTTYSEGGMSEISGLGYLGFVASDIDAWHTWATSVAGLQVATPSDTGDSAYFRIDDRAWRIAVRRADRNALDYVGWEVADPGALGRLAERLAAVGVAAEWDTETARTRQVDALLTCSDPGGNRLEFYCGGRMARDRFVSPRGVRFVTGPLGMGHILVQVADETATKHFYLDVLGFRLSDTVTFGRNRSHFLRVNARHHSLGFFTVPDEAPALHHFMLEVDTLDAVGEALDRVNAGGAVLTETLGKHVNDHMVSFFMRNPSGSQTEYGWAGRLIDERTWTAASYDATAYWGHKLPGSEYSAAGPVSPRDEA